VVIGANNSKCLASRCGGASVVYAVAHVGDSYSIGGAILLGMRVLVLCSAVMMFGQEVKHLIIDPHVLYLA
jgi:hypothetical protein